LHPLLRNFEGFAGESRPLKASAREGNRAGGLEAIRESLMKASTAGRIPATAIVKKKDRSWPVSGLTKTPLHLPA
jgi:hypothetical protein